jgi:two-component system chemotaxis response regulator CheY
MELLRCLVVDDDELGRELLMLDLNGIACCDTAVNGREAVEKYSASLESAPYDVVFLDVIMPEMDGNDAAAAIRKMELERGVTADKGVNIIIVSSQNTPHEIIKSYVSAKSAAHLVKPLNAEKLKKTLRKLGLIPEEV